MIHLDRYSFGVGDRFGRQGRAQLRACMLAAEHGVDAVPVWNKSHREHTIAGTEPIAARKAADAAVHELGWKRPYFVDADHINLTNVGGFIGACDFYTLDVAYAIGVPAGAAEVDAFLRRHSELARRQITIDGLEEPLEIPRAERLRIASKYLFAAAEAGRIYRRIEDAKGRGSFVTEVSMDETDMPQTPPELLIILAALADEGIPAATIAPKFTGRFNKGVDYQGDIAAFEKEFRTDLAVIAHAVREYGLPEELKLSIHSGSDKFSIYGPIRRALAKFGAGIHVKTAGTTWLEELIGLAESGGEALALAKEIYAGAFAHRDDLCAPYAAVIDIDASLLPAPIDVWHWHGEEYAAALRHDQRCPAFNPHFRQLLHVGYKVAANLGERYLTMVDGCEATIARNVTGNLFERHMKPLFV